MVGPLDNYVVKDFKAFWSCVGMVTCHHRLMSIYSTSDKASLQELDRLFSKSHFKIADADEIVSSCFGKRQLKWLQPFKSRETAFLIDSRWACTHLASASSETCENGLSTMVWQSASGVCSHDFMAGCWNSSSAANGSTGLFDSNFQTGKAIRSASTWQTGPAGSRAQFLPQIMRPT